MKPVWSSQYERLSAVLDCAYLRPEDFCRSVYIVDIDQNARPDLVAVVGFLILAETERSLAG